VRSLFFLLLAGIAPEALAWGLQTHLYLAQKTFIAVPPAFWPLVLAGACLPDLALAGKLLGTPAFRRAHRWSTLRRLAAAPRDDADRALAVGYASHLLADVVAHNGFVPEHESRIFRVPHFTHALAEWAMDCHVSRRAPLSPTGALMDNRAVVVEFTARAFRCDASLAQRAVDLLAQADGLLRASRIPALCLQLVGSRGFDAYLGRAVASLARLEAALAGTLVDWVASDPEGCTRNGATDERAGEHVARIM